MSEVSRYGNSNVRSCVPLSGKDARQIARLRSRASVSLEQINASAEIESARADAVAFVGRRALQDVALLSQVEQQLAEAVPHASGRLASIADLTAIALSEVVVDAARRIGR